MSSPEPGGRSRPLRVAGLALLGLAVGALIVGLISIGGGDGDGDGDGGGNAAPSSGPSTGPGSGSSSSEPGSGGPTSGASSSGGPGSGAPATSTTPAPVTTQPANQPAPPTTAAPAPPPIPAVAVRVYNNSTIRGLAAQAADDFRRAGWNVVEVANYPNARIPTSTVYFRPGTDEESAARRLGDHFNLRVEPRFPGIVAASPGLIVIVTNDYGSK